MTADAKRTHFLRGWKIMSVQNRKVASKEDCHREMTMHKGQAWTMVMQPRSKKVIVTPEAQRIASRMLKALEGITPTIPLRKIPHANGWEGGGRPTLMVNKTNGGLEDGSLWKMVTPKSHQRFGGSHCKASSVTSPGI